MEQKAWIIDEKTAKQYLTVEDAIDCVEKTWKWYGEGRVIMPNKITTDMSELGVAGWFNSMPAYIGPMDVDRRYGYFTTVIIKKNGGKKE